MDNELLSHSRDVKQNIHRNIVSLRISENLFDDLTDGDEALTSLATQVEMRVKSHIPADLISRGFHYTTAINYPFEVDNYLATRYSDGTFPAWYGSLDEMTTIMETAYHMMINELNRENIANYNGEIVRERAMYKIHCQALLIDLSDKAEKYPDLIADNYEYTQQLGRRLQHEGHPGLLVPSARYKGTNVVIFNQQVLTDPKLTHYLTYTFNPRRKTVRVERNPGKTLKLVSLDKCRRTS